MKRFFFTLLVMGMTVSLVEASNKTGSDKTPGKTGGAIDKGTVKKMGDVIPAKVKVSDKKISDAGKSKVVDKKVDKKVDKVGKIDIHGNKNVAKMPGFKSDHKRHDRYCKTYRVPHHLHHQCFFHHDFCWNHHCWLPTHRCCGYWHPHARCWYYWYEPYCCYLPYSCIQTYVPVAVVQPASVDVYGAEDPSSPPMLPQGASYALPQGVNPMIPMPK